MRHPGPGSLGEMGGHKDYTGLKVGREILVSKDVLAEHQKSSKVHTCLSEKSAVKILVQNEPFSGMRSGLRSLGTAGLGSLGTGSHPCCSRALHSRHPLLPELGPTPRKPRPRKRCGCGGLSHTFTLASSPVSWPPCPALLVSTPGTQLSRS